MAAAIAGTVYEAATRRSVKLRRERPSRCGGSDGEAGNVKAGPGKAARRAASPVSVMLRTLPIMECISVLTSSAAWIVTTRAVPEAFGGGWRFES
ncbi:hypothetical protein GCM10009712_17920 [Pseudarthrobacter sulfonivorans]